MADFLGTVVGSCVDNQLVRTKVGDCDVIPGKISGLLITRRGATFDPATFAADLEANIVSGKIIPVTGLEIPAVAGFDIQSSTPDSGGLRYIGINPPQFAIPVTNGGTCRMKSLAALDLRFMSYMWMERDGSGYRIWATTKLNKDGEEVISGFDGQNLVSKTFMTNSTTPFVLTFNISFDTSFNDQFNNASTFIIPDTPILEGLMGIELVPGTAGTARIVSSCTGQDVGTDIAAMFDGTLQTAFIQESGTAATTADIDPDTGLVTIAPAGSYRIASAPVLDGLGIVGYDGTNKFATIVAGS